MYKGKGQSCRRRGTVRVRMCMEKVDCVYCTEGKRLAWGR